MVKASNPHGETVYWVGAAGKAQDAGDGTDFHALAQQCVSLTPLQIDLTQYNQIDAVRGWISASTARRAGAGTNVSRAPAGQ